MNTASLFVKNDRLKGTRTLDYRSYNNQSIVHAVCVHGSIPVYTHV